MKKNPNPVIERLQNLIKTDQRSKEEIQSAKLTLSVELFSTGVALKRENLKRTFPEASEEDIEKKIVEWLQDRPDDAPEPYFRKRT